MIKKILGILLVSVLILAFVEPQLMQVHAQEITIQNDIPLLQITSSEIVLLGPSGSSTLTFGLPVNWSLSPGAKILLNLAVSFTLPKITGQTDVITNLPGGTLTVRFNGVSVGMLTLDQNGEVTEALNLPTSSLVSQRNDGRMELAFILSGGNMLNCGNQQLQVYIHTNSIITLPHNFIDPDTSLINFPRQLNVDSVLSESAVIVIPDQPTSAELQAALTVSAGLGGLTGTVLALDIATVSTLTAEQQASNQLIIVGKSSSLSILKGLPLPFGLENGQFLLDIGMEDNGVIQLVSSPWSQGKVALVVSGNTDVGVIKAAQAVSSGSLQSTTLPNVAMVETVVATQSVIATRVDQSLIDLTQDKMNTVATLGKAVKTLKFGGSSSASYQFYIPPGQTVSSDAYFDLVYGHSTLLNYARSGAVININGQPIGTVRVSDLSATQTNNHVQFNIPSTVIVPGFNTLDIRANLVPNDSCSIIGFDGYWITIWPDSLLHLPLQPNQIATTSLIDLSSYPAPFALDPSLSTTAFVLPHTDMDAWRSAIRIANYLGNRTKGALFTPAAYYADELKDPERSKFNLLIVGRPSQLAIMAEINDNLPAPFDQGSDVAKASNLQIKFTIPGSSPAGYIELMASPWNPDNLIIGALGNSSQGVSWAGSALVDAPLRNLLAGNFAAIRGAQVISTDTRLATFNISSDLINNILVPTVHDGKVNLLAPKAAPPKWILPAIYLSVFLVVVVLIIAVFMSWKASKNPLAKK